MKTRVYTRNKQGIKRFFKGMNGLTLLQKEVYTVVKGIAPGEVRTYKWVARMVGKPAASRAIGNALRRNPFPLIVPCHRVIKSDGAIGDYMFGRDLKLRLLRAEGVRLELKKRNKGGLIYAARVKR